MGTEFIACVFPGSTKEYIYSRGTYNVEVGDHVNVHTKTGLQTLKVVKVNIQNTLPAKVKVAEILGVSPI